MFDIFFLQCSVTLLKGSVLLLWLFLVLQIVVVQKDTVIYLPTCQIKSYNRHQSWDTYWDTTGSHKGSFTEQELGRSSEDLMTGLIIDFSIWLLCLLWTVILSEHTKFHVYSVHTFQGHLSCFTSLFSSVAWVERLKTVCVHCSSYQRFSSL